MVAHSILFCPTINFIRAGIHSYLIKIITNFIKMECKNSAFNFFMRTFFWRLWNQYKSLKGMLTIFPTTNYKGVHLWINTVEYCDHLHMGQIFVVLGCSLIWYKFTAHNIRVKCFKGPVLSLILHSLHIRRTFFCGFFSCFV